MRSILLPISQLRKITRKIFQIWSAPAGYKDQCREIKANGKLRNIHNGRQQAAITENTFITLD